MKRAARPFAPADRRPGNRRVGAIVALSALAMIGAAYAAVPLYAAFCKATGFAGTTQVARIASGVEGARRLTVRFDANVAPGLDWSFEPETASVTVRTGATATVFFRVRNRAAGETAAVAVYNVTPEVSGAWFDKVSCFCFSEQRLVSDKLSSVARIRAGCRPRALVDAAAQQLRRRRQCALGRTIAVDAAQIDVVADDDVRRHFEQRLELARLHLGGGDGAPESADVARHADDAFDASGRVALGVEFDRKIDRPAVSDGSVLGNMMNLAQDRIGSYVRFSSE